MGARTCRRALGAAAAIQRPREHRFLPKRAAVGAEAGKRRHDGPGEALHRTMARAAAASGNPYAPRHRRPIGADPQKRDSNAATRTPDLANAAAAHKNTAPGGDPPRRSIPWNGCEASRSRRRSSRSGKLVGDSLMLLSCITYSPTIGLALLAESELSLQPMAQSRLLPRSEAIYGRNTPRPGARSAVSDEVKMVWAQLDPSSSNEPTQLRTPHQRLIAEQTQGDRAAECRH